MLHRPKLANLLSFARRIRASGRQMGGTDMSDVVVVTLTYDNVDEARKTLASVALQRVGPSRYVIVDSSETAEASDIKKLATLANGEYHWIPPRGVYPAMNYALSLLEDDDYVWFINSSDWLSGQESLAEMEKQLLTGTEWVIGGLSRLGDSKNPFHPVPASATDFVELLRIGAIGFPHPAAIMSVGKIRQIGGFDTSLLVAADYKLALGFANLVGKPAMTRQIVAVHVPTGLTSKNRVRHAWEKLVARRGTLSKCGLLPEVKTQLMAILNYMGFSPAWKKRVHEFPLTNAFAGEIDSWPDGDRSG